MFFFNLLTDCFFTLYINFFYKKKNEKKRDRIGVCLMIEIIWKNILRCALMIDLLYLTKYFSNSRSFHDFSQSNPRFGQFSSFYQSSLRSKLMASSKSFMTILF